MGWLSRSGRRIGSLPGANHEDGCATCVCSAAFAPPQELRNITSPKNVARRISVANGRMKRARALRCHRSERDQCVRVHGGVDARHKDSTAHSEVGRSKSISDERVVAEKSDEGDRSKP